MDEPRDDAERDRWYGVRQGDEVREEAFGMSRTGVVVHLDRLDNNAVYARIRGRQNPVKMVAEFCTVVSRAEERHP